MENARISNGVPCNFVGRSAKLIVPVAPYNNEMPNNNMPEENAEDKIIFIAPSEDLFLLRSKFAIAATGILASSSDK